MAEFNQTDFDTHFFALRDMGCAVIALTPEDVANQFLDENDDPMSRDEAAAWLRDNQDSVEEAILGDYWGDTLYDLKSWTNKKEQESA